MPPLALFLGRRKEERGYSVCCPFFDEFQFANIFLSYILLILGLRECSLSLPCGLVSSCRLNLCTSTLSNIVPIPISTSDAHLHLYIPLLHLSSVRYLLAVYPGEVCTCMQFVDDFWQ